MNEIVFFSMVDREDFMKCRTSPDLIKSKTVAGWPSSIGTTMADLIFGIGTAVLPDSDSC